MASERQLKSAEFAGNELEVSDGAAISELRTYKLFGDRFSYEMREPRQVGPGEYHFVVGRHGDRKLDTAEAKNVWARIEKLKIERWKQRYSPRDLGTDVLDGPEWSVRLLFEGKTTSSTGLSAFPAHTNPSQTILIYSGANEYDELIGILKSLEP